MTPIGDQISFRCLVVYLEPAGWAVSVCYPVETLLKACCQERLMHSVLFLSLSLSLSLSLFCNVAVAVTLAGGSIVQPLQCPYIRLRHFNCFQLLSEQNNLKI